MPRKKPKKDWSAINNRIKNRNKKFKADERIFVPTLNDKNQAKVIMRFLDSPDTELPYARQYTHFFKDFGGWFIETCPTTHEDKSCPVCDDLYKQNYYETDNDLYYDRKKNLYYYMNALIIENKNKPEDEGKVFLFKFGKKIMDKIDDAIDDDKFIWDEDEGVNFVFSMKKNGKMTSYDASYFSDTQTSLDEYGDVDKILKQCHNLAEFEEKAVVKSYDELKEKYERVINSSVDTDSDKPARKKRKMSEEFEEDEEILDDDIDTQDDGDIGDGNMYDEDDDDDDSFFDDLEDDDDE